jgi:uncharacterized protein YecT (DUF1311 family)
VNGYFSNPPSVETRLVESGGSALLNAQRAWIDYVRGNARARDRERERERNREREREDHVWTALPCRPKRQGR